MGTPAAHVLHNCTAAPLRVHWCMPGRPQRICQTTICDCIAAMLTRYRPTTEYLARSRVGTTAVTLCVGLYVLLPGPSASTTCSFTLSSQHSRPGLSISGEKLLFTPPVRRLKSVTSLSLSSPTNCPRSCCSCLLTVLLFFCRRSRKGLGQPSSS